MFKHWCDFVRSSLGLIPEANFFDTCSGKTTLQGEAFQALWFWPIVKTCKKNPRKSNPQRVKIVHMWNSHSYRQRQESCWDWTRRSVWEVAASESKSCGFSLICTIRKLGVSCKISHQHLDKYFALWIVHMNKKLLSERSFWWIIEELRTVFRTNTEAQSTHKEQVMLQVMHAIYILCLKCKPANPPLVCM